MAATRVKRSDKRVARMKVAFMVMMVIGDGGARGGETWRGWKEDGRGEKREGEEGWWGPVSKTVGAWV